MRDNNLKGLLNQRVHLDRATVRVGGGLEVGTPVGERVAELRGLVQARSGGAAEDLLGLLPEATHVVYLEREAPEVKTGDVLAVVVEGMEREYEVLSAGDEAGQGHHRRVQVRGKEL